MARPSSTLCPSCGQLVGVNDAECLNCGRRNPGMWGFAHVLRGFQDEGAFAQLVLWVCGALYLASLVVDLEGVRTGGFSLVSPSIKSLFMFGASGAIPVVGYQRWWTLLSATWLHGGVLHLLFNMYWVRLLAPETAQLYGVGRTVIIYTVSGVVGFLASSLAFFLPLPSFLRGSEITVGASAALFGLLGALLYYGRRGSSHVGRQAKSLAVMLLVFGFVMHGLGIDNWAHLGGLGGGYLVAKWLNPLKPERGDHLLWAAGCLLASLLAILVSVVDGLKILR